jgi:hypothetical protein
MDNFAWLSQQAQQIHAIFNGLFYVLVLTLLSLGLLIEYFKWPLGGTPAFTQLVGRALVAAILLHSLPEVMNAIADVTDALTKQLGDFNQVKSVFEVMRHRLQDMSVSWVSVKESVTWIISFLGFYLLYLTYFVADACVLYGWTLLYIFSPLLIALFVLPATAGATKALYKSLIEISCWKIIWSVLATLLWSTALSQINKPGTDINFITVICYSLLLAISILLTPYAVHALAGGGISSLAMAAGGLMTGRAISKAKAIPRQTARTVSGGAKTANYIAERREKHQDKKLYRHTPTPKSKEPKTMSDEKRTKKESPTGKKLEL